MAGPEEPPPGDLLASSPLPGAPNRPEERELSPLVGYGTARAFQPRFGATVSENRLRTPRRDQEQFAAKLGRLGGGLFEEIEPHECQDFLRCCLLARCAAGEEDVYTSGYVLVGMYLCFLTNLGV